MLNLNSQTKDVIINEVITDTNNDFVDKDIFEKDKYDEDESVKVLRKLYMNDRLV